jgi:ATP-dependent RNA helicase SUPV3L1/SUV3
VVDGAIIGTLAGFAFQPDPAARAGEKKMLLAAAERRLAHAMKERAAALARDADGAFALAFDGTLPPRLLWRGARVAVLRPGRDALHPRIEADRSRATLDTADRAAVLARLTAFIEAGKARHLAALGRVAALGASVSAPARGLVHQLVETMGALPRTAVADLIAALSAEDRRLLARAGVRLGQMHVYVAAALKPEPTRWRLALWGVAAGIAAMPAPPAAGRTAIPVAADAPAGFHAVAGFWALDGFAIRIDIADRLARDLHAMRSASGPPAEADWTALRGRTGLGPDDFTTLLRALGFRSGRAGGLTFDRNHLTPRTAAPAGARPFARLADLMGG